MLCNLCPFASSMDIYAECSLPWYTFQFIFLNFLGGWGAALLNLYHISLAYELLPALSVIILYDMIQNFKMMTFDLRNNIRSQRAKTHKFMCLSLLNTVISFTHDFQAQLFAEFWSFSFHTLLLSTWVGRVSVWVCHWKWKCQCPFRNFKGWGLLSLSEDSCQNYTVIAVTLNALHIYILPAYGSSAHFLVMSFHFLLPVNPVYCSCRPFFCNKQFHTSSFDLFLGFLAGLFPIRLCPSIWYDLVGKHPYYMPSPL